MLRILGESGILNESERNSLLRLTKPTFATTTTARPSITTRRSTFFSDLVTSKKPDMDKGKRFFKVYSKALGKLSDNRALSRKIVSLTSSGAEFLNFGQSAPSSDCFDKLETPDRCLGLKIPTEGKLRLYSQRLSI